MSKNELLLDIKHYHAVVCDYRLSPFTFVECTDSLYKPHKVYLLNHRMYEDRQPVPSFNWWKD